MPTRAFHWLLVAVVLALLCTGYLLGDSWLRLHLFAGYGLAILLVLRLVWWIFGPGYSRLSALTRAIAQLPGFVPALLRLRPPHYAGHNPAGSAMIIILITALLALAITGFMIEGGEEKRGALAGITSYATGDFAHQIHAVLATILLGLIALHLGGVAFETIVQRVNLVRGMITGRMALTPNLPGWDERPAKPLAALVTIGVIAAVGGFAVSNLYALPPLGAPTLATNATYQANCSDCHMLYHPSLLPAASWAKLMGALDDHFGEDASLPADKVSEITTYLTTNASEHFDTEVANRLRLVSDAAPFEITQTPFWQRKHQGLSADVFKRPQVKTKSNCQACHSDAASGRFDDDQISIPDTTNTGG